MVNNIVGNCLGSAAVSGGEHSNVMAASEVSGSMPGSGPKKSWVFLVF